MSNGTKIYAYCPAGCRYRTVPYDEFINSASIVEQARNGYTYNLEKGRTYRLKNDNAATHWGVSVTVSTSWNVGDSTATGMFTLTLPAFDKYAKGVKISVLDVAGVYDSDGRTCSFSAVYEVDGERHTETFADGDFLASNEPTENISYSIVATCTTDYETDLHCWLFNEDAEVKFNAEDLPEVTDADDGKVLSVVGGKWVADDRLTAIEQGMADLLYKEIGVTSFSNNIGTVEIGSTVDSVTLSWKLNKKPESVTVDGETQSATAEGSVVKSGLKLTANKTWTLKATDERGAIATKNTSVSFANGVYYGAAADGAMNSAFILGLSKTLRSNKLPSFTVNAAAGQYIYYCVPTRYGTCAFSVGGFSGGFSLATTTEFTNASGYTEEYYVYKSDNTGLGKTTVAVS